MFGYIRPLVGQMLVSENEFYRALYCGLCRSMGRHTGCASRFTLSYDFVFLCAYRAAIEGVKFTQHAHRCAVHPVKKRPMADDNGVFAYAASAAAILNAAKLADDAADETGAKRLAAKMLTPTAGRIRKRADSMDALEASVGKHLSALSEMERAGCASLDETARAFGELLGDIFAFGLDGTNERISREVGRAVGRFIYVTDAADDAADDAKSGSYNPILRLYADEATEPSSLLTERTMKDRAGNPHTRLRLREDVAESILTATLNDLASLERAIELIDFSRCDAETAGIVKNTVYLGMPAEIRRVLALP